MIEENKEVDLKALKFSPDEIEIFNAFNQIQVKRTELSEAIAHFVFLSMNRGKK